jgi:uncharacterized membrane protein
MAITKKPQSKETQPSSAKVTEGKKAPTQDEKTYAAIGYIWILCFIPLLLKGDSKFCKFHGKQALVLFIIEIIGSVVYWIPIFGWLLGLAVLVLAIIGLVKALQGEYYKVPVVYNLVKKLNL